MVLGALSQLSLSRYEQLPAVNYRRTDGNDIGIMFSFGVNLLNQTGIKYVENGYADSLLGKGRNAPGYFIIVMLKL